LNKFGLVIIGAHIGVHIIKDLEEYKGQKVILVEPVPHNLRALNENLIDYQNIKIEPVCVGGQNLSKNFYFIKETSINKLGKHWASGIGSFDKQHILTHKTKRFKVQDEDIEVMEIKTLTINDLIKKYEISSIDKLQIDVEGSEYEILKSLNFSEISINKIIFESKHFDGTFKEGPKLEEIKKKLVENNYTITQIDSENILAKKL